jgi:hypothetical protein
MPIRDRPILTKTYSSIYQFRPEPGSVYVFGSSGEDRSAHSKEWSAKATGVEFVIITGQESSAFTIETKDGPVRYALRSTEQLKSFVESFQKRHIYLDITGLGHHIWAPIIRTCLTRGESLSAIYVEPDDYRFSATPTEGEIFDLSERINGISPIPGFVTLSDRENNRVCFIPLLGFEGTRLAYLIEQVQPPGGKIFPIIGVPGFRPQYPFFTYHGNKSALIQHQAWKSVRFASANCPFSLFYALEDIAKDYPQDMLKIAPIGTKPHALGAILYALARPQNVEIVYDHPIRKPTRTEGTFRLMVYRISILPLR